MRRNTRPVEPAPRQATRARQRSAVSKPKPVQRKRKHRPRPASRFTARPCCDREVNMQHVLPKLPYAIDGLEPHFSKETLEYHYHKHHQAYVTNLNNMISGTEFENESLENIVRTARAGPIFNNAAQAWNHTFFWLGLHPNPGDKTRALAPGPLADAIKDRFGSFAKFKKVFCASAASNFGSGWTWLVKQPDGTLDVINTHDAATPLTTDNQPLLAADLWEHAYYIDFRNDRPSYLDAFFKLVHWVVVAARYSRTQN